MRYGILIFALLFTRPVISQQHVFMTYTVNDGLIANSVRRIVQDSKGFLWLSTWEGLSKYDGYMFSNFTTSNGLSHNLVNDVYERGNKLYIACNNGDVDIIEDGSISQRAFTNLVINRFISDIPGRIIAATDINGLQEFNTDKFRKPGQSFPNGNYYGVGKLNDSMMVAATPTSIQLLDNNYRLVSATDSANPVFSYCIYRNSRGQVWAGTTSGLRLISPLQQKGSKLGLLPLPAPFNNTSLARSSIHDIMEDDQGTMWFATENGLVMVTSSGFMEKFDNRSGLPSSNVSCVMQDREGNIWIGTALGLAKLITRNRILTYKTANGLFSDFLVFLLQLDSTRMLTGGKGVQVFDSREKKFGPPQHATHLYEGFVPGSPEVILVRNNQLWHLSSPIQSPKAIRLSPSPQSISVAIRDRFENYFIANDRHLLVYNKDGRLLDSLTIPLLNSLQIDKAGNIWAGTRNDGLHCIRYAFNNGRVSLLSTSQFLESRNIRSLFIDRDGNTWAGTRYDGVYRLHPEQNGNYSILQLNQAGGLTSNWIRAISQTGDGSIWLGFYQGLDKLCTDGSQYRIFNFSRINNFYASINGIIPGGQHDLWLATIQGMSHIVDGQLENLPPKPVYITNIISPDSSYTSATSSLSLSHTRNQLQFWFTSPAFINEKQVLYSYRLIGGNSEWSKPSNLHTVSYANLRPGNYIFEVRSLGWNNVWGQSSQFQFSVSPPFWQRPLFIIAVVLLIGLLTVWLVSRRIKNIRQQAELKHRITEKEMIALRTQMNPHFIFNSLNSIDNLIQNNEKEKATTYLARFAKLIRAILESSKQEVIPLWKDLETLQLYLDLELLRCDNKFSYTIDMDPELLQGDYKIPPLIIQPFVENAIHHGLLNKKENDRRLSVRGYVENGHIRLIIKDNGVGTEQAARFKQLNKPAHQSMGHTITRERIELHNGGAIANPLTITELGEDNHPAGTCVTILLLNK